MALELGDSLSLVMLPVFNVDFGSIRIDVDFLVSDRAVLDAARHDDKFAFLDDGFVGSGISSAACLSRPETVRLRFMMMPDKFAF